MNKLSGKKILAIILVFFVILALVIIKFVPKNKNSVPTPTVIPFSKVEYKELIIGSSTKEETYQKLGSPISEEDINGDRIIQFKSNNPNYNNELTFKSDKLSFVKEIISPTDLINVSDIEQKYGNYTKVFYGPSSGLGFDLYSYPEQGIAYIGNQYIGDVIEIWYFPPTNTQSFKDIYATEYSETRQPIQ